MITEETMKAAVQDRMREAEQLHTAGEARRAAGRRRRGRAEGWTWTVSPGMGEAFATLRGWLLSGAGGDRVQYSPTDTKSS